MKNTEIEVRFLEIDKKKLIKKLKALGAVDMGEERLEEIIFYDKDYKWRDKENKFVRIRKNSKGAHLSYKHHKKSAVDGAEEIEFSLNDSQKGEEFLYKVGLVAYRRQEKKRHTFQLGKVTVDIDEWPRIPVYVELEGKSEKALKDAAKKLELDWADVVTDNARTIIEGKYGVPVGSMKWFTFNKFE